MSNTFTRWLARHTMTSLIKTDLQSKQAKECTNQNALLKFIYHNHDNVYKKYGITFEEVKVEVEKQQSGKKGVMGKIALKNANRSVKSAIKEGRIKFIGNDKIEYVDRNGEMFTYTFDEMAERMIDNVGGQQKALMVGIVTNDFRKMIDNEYSKVRSN